MGCGNVVVTSSYRLRSAGPFGTLMGFINQTFMAEKRTVRTLEATDTILTSCDMSGLGGNYESAHYTSLPYRTAGGVMVFNGTEVSRPVYIDEDSMGM